MTGRTTDGTSMLVDLARHCRVGDTQPHVYGKLDCSIWCADWVRLQTGVDLAADWRGQYSSREEYLRLLVRQGGLVRVAARALKKIGATMIEPVDAQPGDIGIIVVEPREPALAIRCQTAWKAKTGDQLMSTPHATFAWRI